MNCSCCLSNISIAVEFEICIDDENKGFYLCAECAKEILGTKQLIQECDELMEKYGKTVILNKDSVKS